MKEGALDRLGRLAERFAALEVLTAEAAEVALREQAEAEGVSAGAFIHPVRVAVSGMAAGPSLFDMLAVLGKERVYKRMERTISMFSEGGAALPTPGKET